MAAAVKIGSGWQQVGGDLDLKLDLVQLGHQQILARARGGLSFPMI
jgi:hypothetical protein